MTVSLRKGWAIGIIALFLCLVLSLLLGTGDISFTRSLSWLLFGNDEQAAFVILELRGTRTLLGVVVGAALAAAGAVLQTMKRNPLAERGLLGGGAGASCSMGVCV